MSARDEAKRMGDALEAAIAAVYDELNLSAEDRLLATAVVARELSRFDARPHTKGETTMTDSTAATRRARAEAEADQKIQAALDDGRIRPASKKAWRDAILPKGKTELVAAKVRQLESLAAYIPATTGHTESEAHGAIMSSFGVRSAAAAAEPAPRIGELGLEQADEADEEFMTAYRARMLS